MVAARDGIVSWTRLAAVGLSADSVRHQLDEGRLVRVGNGVWRMRDHPLDRRARCRAGLDLAGEGAVLGLRTASRLHGLYQLRTFEDVEVLVRRGRDHRCEHARVVQTRWLPPDHVTEIDGFPVTTLARTIFDLCGDPDGYLRVNHPAHERRMEQLCNDALARRGLTFVQQSAVLLTMAKRGRSGTRLMRRLLLRFGPSYTPTRSDTETLFAILLREYGVPDPERQVVITDDRGQFIGTVDCYWRTAKHVVEVDSTWHDGPLDRVADADRDRRLREAGYTVARYRYGDLVARPAAVARELGAILGPYTPKIAPRTEG